MNEQNESQTSFPIETDKCPCRVDKYLAMELETLSRSRIHTLIEAGDIRVDGKAIKPRLILTGGETITIDLPALEIPLPKAEDIPLDILYEDSDLLVVNKPAGMVVHPGAGIPSGTLVNALLYHCKDLSGIGGVIRPGIVHRLDRLTSGCLVVAKNDVTHQALSLQLSERTMRRVYLAWISGQPSENEGRVEAPIGRSFRNRTRMAVTGKGGRHAATNWRVLARVPGLARIECSLETGRTHQIRVHMAYIGYPVLGDHEYGISPREARMLVPPGYPCIIQALSQCSRQMLHAHRLLFQHPATGEQMEFTTPPPEDFTNLDEALNPYIGQV